MVRLVLHNQRWYAPLAALVAVGLVVRAYASAAYATVITSYYPGDAGRYLRVGFDGMFSDPWQPAGYPLFLAAVRGLTDELTITVLLQHGLGIATGLLLYAAVRAAGGSRVSALLPAAWVLLSGDHVFIEHAFLTEALWLPLLATGLYAAVRGADAQDARWLAVAGAALGASVVVRNVSAPLIVLLGLWLLLVTGGPLVGRVRAAAVAVAPAMVVIAAYIVVAGASGPYTGLGEMSGWSLYARTAQFADCRQFDPPGGTAALCEDRPTGARPGPFYYLWSEEAPARTTKYATHDPRLDEEVGDFAQRAVLAQPLDYVRTVIKDTVRFVDPYFGFDRELSGTTPEAISFQADFERQPFADVVEGLYGPMRATPGPGSQLLETWHEVFRLTGLLLVGLLVLAGVSLVRGTARTRRVGLLVLSWAAVLLVLPPAVSSYDSRYAIPPAMVLSVAAALGLGALRPAARASSTTRPASGPGTSMTSEELPMAVSRS